jgi:putative tryptophan/tyrosine transport system substrate-binding protein
MIDRRTLLQWGTAALAGGIVAESVRYFVSRPPAQGRVDPEASVAEQRSTPAPIGKVYRLVVLSPGARVEDMREEGNNRGYDRLFRELRLRGYVEGQNLEIKRLNAIGLAEKDWSNVAREAVAWDPDIMHVTATRMALLVKERTATIPIVFNGLDPIAMGLVPNIARPGANITGFASDAGSELWQKMMQLVLEAVPGARSIGILSPPDMWDGPIGDAFRAGALKLGVPLQPVFVAGGVDEAALRRVFSNLSREKVPALVLGPANEFNNNARLIGELTRSAAIPAVAETYTFVEGGGLMSYGRSPDEVLNSMARHAEYIDRILEGEKPGELPIQQPMLFDFGLNLKTARELGVEVPTGLLLLATKVIE